MELIYNTFTCALFTSSIRKISNSIKNNKIWCKMYPFKDAYNSVSLSRRSFKNSIYIYIYTLPLRWYSRRSESNSANRNDVPDFERSNAWRCDPRNTLYRTLSLQACIDRMRCICKYRVTLRRIAELKKQADPRIRSVYTMRIRSSNLCYIYNDANWK